MRARSPARRPAAGASSATWSRPASRPSASSASGPATVPAAARSAQLALASVLIAQHQPDQACGIATDVLNATQSLGSYLVISQLIQLQRQLEPYSGNTVVTEFLNCLQDAVRDRLAFYQLTAEGQQRAGKAWEEP